MNVKSDQANDGQASRTNGRLPDMQQGRQKVKIKVKVVEVKGFAPKHAVRLLGSIAIVSCQKKPCTEYRGTRYRQQSSRSEKVNQR